jgi:hypothetical protein
MFAFKNVINKIPCVHTIMKCAAQGNVAWYVVTSVLEECTTSSFRIENGGGMFI